MGKETELDQDLLVKFRAHDRNGDGFLAAGEMRFIKEIRLLHHKTHR